MKRTIAISDSFLAFAVVVVTASGLVTVITVAFVPRAIRLLDAFT